MPRAKKKETAAEATPKKAVKVTAAVKAPEQPEPELQAAVAAYVQYQGEELDISVLAENAKTAFAAEHADVKIAEVRLYVKPEERAAYYVINGEFNGCVKY